MRLELVKLLLVMRGLMCTSVDACSQHELRGEMPRLRHLDPYQTVKGRKPPATVQISSTLL